MCYKIGERTRKSNFLRIKKMAIVQNQTKAICHKKDINCQKEGQARQFEKKESTKNISVIKQTTFGQGEHSLQFG